MKVRRVVVKIGTSILVDKAGQFSHRALVGVATDIAAVQKKGAHVTLVSSGAIASGMNYLGFRKKPSRISELQACAAIGQPILMQMYQKAFRKTRLQAAQILLTRSDLTDRARFLNAQNTLSELLRRNVIPVINENDTVITEEIRVGDNDNLAALVTHLVDADLLILLTDQDGFYTSDPRKDPRAKKIPVVSKVDGDILSRASHAGSEHTVGGMRTKIEAVRKAARFGTPTIIANGRRSKVLEKIFSGESVGTFFPI